MVINLPDVTVVAIDNVAHRLCRMALEATLDQIRPGAVYVYTDDGRAVPDHFDAFQLYANPANQQEVAEILWYKVPLAVETSHYLVVQWDGWVINGAAWRPEFLEYDYIGAPWWWHDDNHKVGNGGFSLRSTRLARHLIKHRNLFPCREPEDHHLCRTCRPALEAEGFRWAPASLALHFSFEHTPVLHVPCFGFHDMRNWPRFLTDEQIDDRLDAASAYVVKKTDIIQQMLLVRARVRGQQQ
jgi:hypothetical protein